MSELSDLEKRVLDVVQQDIPLVNRPFRNMSDKAGTDEESFLQCVQSLFDRDLIRDISAIYNARGLGYQSTLVAVSTASPDKTANAISRYPGVSHNYYREHHFNVWFTLTIPEERDLDEVIRQILKDENYDSFRILPSIKTYKIGVNFRFSGEKKKKTINNYSSRIDSVDINRDLIRKMQTPFPLVPEPWSEIADALGKSEEELFREIDILKKAKVIKRISGVIRHRKTGFGANGMACFQLSEDNIDSAGEKAARYSAVSHCYRRPVFPDWPYSLFAMTHGAAEEECENTAAEIATEIDAEKTLVLYSTKEYKKERVKYFLE